MDPFPLEQLGCPTQHGGALAALRLLRSYNHFIMPPDFHSVLTPLLGSLPPACAPYCPYPPPSPPDLDLSSPGSEGRRCRGEKRPIPQELKDDKYFERRRRNNQAAKKSRDARRVREDQIAWRACVLEQENAALRAHVTALRREATALRALLARTDVPAPAPTSTTGD